MPSNKTRNTLARQWDLLRLLPSRGTGKTAAEIADALIGAGYKVSKRQVERDLIDLQEIFGLDCNNNSIPYGWRWGAIVPDMPSITMAEAVSLKIIEDTLKPLLPSSLLRAIEPRLQLAKDKISALSEHNSWAKWGEKVASVTPAFPMEAPSVDESILDIVQNALLESEQILANYKPFAADPMSITLNPLGLVVRGGVTYLIATAFEYQDVRMYALHRFESVERTYKKSLSCRDFCLNSFLDAGAMQFGSSGKVELVATITDVLAKILRETPISTMQRIEQDGDMFKLHAEVQNSWQLHWWVLSQAENIVILEPKQLRNEISRRIQTCADLYKL